MRLIAIFVLLILWFLPAAVFADAAQERRLTISASIFPKIVALDQNITKKTDASGELVLGIVYLNDPDSAQKVINIIQKKVKKLAGVTTIAKALSLKQALETGEKQFAGYLLTEIMPNNELPSVIAHSARKKCLLFSPFEGDIERGVMASIFVGAKIRPYFNLSALKNANIDLKPAILKVSKTYE